jgi:hypothetical protein
MELIAHRGLWNSEIKSNSRAALANALDAGYGLETDIRAHDGELYLSHDPIHETKTLVRLTELLDLGVQYRDQRLFLNVKEDGLLPLLLKHRTLIEKLKVVFFDMSVPQLVLYARVFAPEKLATRLSDVEPHPCLVQHCDWIWVDAFERDWPVEEIRRIKRHFKRNLALVSPELHRRDPAALWKALTSAPDLTTPSGEMAICTDQPAIFQQELHR